MQAGSVDRSYEALIALDTSWNLNARLANVCPEGQVTSTLLSRLFLVTHQNQVQIALKPNREWFDPLLRLITGEGEDVTFSRQVQKIKLFFQTISKPLTEEEKAKLVSLEEKVNALGRYVYSGRCNKTLLCFGAPRFAEYQVHYSAPLDLIKPGVIKRGLSNPNARLCWLNSALKYMSASTTYDQLLSTPQEQPQLEALRQALFRLVDALRKNWDQNIIDGLHQELIEVIDMGPFKPFLSAQQDADEFLLHLQNNFTDPVREPIQTIKLYKSFSEKHCKDGIIQATQRLQIVPQAEGEEIDIHDSFTVEGVDDDIKEYYLKEKDGLIPTDPKAQETEKLSFKVQELFMSLPEILEVTLRRGIGFNVRQQNGIVTHKKLKILPGGYINLTEYEPVYETIGGVALLVDGKAKGQKRYKIIASIEQRGSTSNRGHYVAYTRDAEGITSHNDRVISHNQTEEAFNSSYHLLLKQEQAS